MGSLGRGARTAVLALAVVFISAGIAQAATTISTNVQTDGTLSVTGLATFLGGASTTQFTLLSGDTIKNATASSTVISGTLQLTGGYVSQASSTVVWNLTVTGNIIKQSGDTIKNASASTTVLSGTLNVDANVTLLNAQAATSTVTAACVVTTATSSVTKIRLMFNTSATTTTLNGNTVQGVVVCGYGSSCLN